MRSELPYAIGLLAGLAVLVPSGYLDLSLDVMGENDFARLWVGARAILEGHDPYDAASWPAVAAALGSPSIVGSVFPYPGWIPVLMLPLAMLPLQVAAVIWTIGGVVAAAVVLRMLLRALIPDLAVIHTLAGLTLLGSQPARTGVFLGQPTFILVAALGAAALYVASRPRIAAVLATVLLAKPQLVLLTFPALLVRALAAGTAWRAVSTFVAAALILLVASLIVLPGWPIAWLAEVPDRHMPAAAPQTTTMAALMSAAFGPPGQIVTFALALVAVWIAASFPPTTNAGLGMWIALSLLVAPYQWSYDQLLLLPAILLVAGGVREIGRFRAVLTGAAAFGVLLVIATLLGAVAAISGTEVTAALIPVLTIAVLVIGALPLRRPLVLPRRSAT